ncbi:MAG: hypothetical protein JW996_06735, partial [Candidatus Cloacimonetes bacterium]|nr:hypothetical protein [Candidatus Cloacimonadota bacterium]
MKIKIISLLCLILIWLNYLATAVFAFFKVYRFNKFRLITTSLTNILVMILFLVFFILLYLEFSRQNDISLKKGAFLSLLGSAVNLLIIFRHGITTAKIPVISGLIHSYLWDMLLPILVYLAYIYFLKILLDKSAARLKELSRAATAGLIGFSITALISFGTMLINLLHPILPRFYQMGPG